MSAVRPCGCAPTPPINFCPHDQEKLTALIAWLDGLRTLPVLAPAEPSPLPIPEYTAENVHTALCIWEWWLERSRDDVAPKHWMGDYQDERGACQTRLMVTEIAPVLDAAWSYAVEAYGYDDAFDWDFVPRYMEASDDFQTCAEDHRGVVNRMLEQPKLVRP